MLPAVPTGRADKVAVGALVWFVVAMCVHDSHVVDQLAPLGDGVGTVTTLEHLRFADFHDVLMPMVLLYTRSHYILLGYHIFVLFCYVLFSWGFFIRTREPKITVPSLLSSPKKVFLYTYMRGGSTFLGSIFDRNPQVTYWYEIADSYFTAKFGLSAWNMPYFVKHFPNGTIR